MNINCTIKNIFLISILILISACSNKQVQNNFNQLQNNSNKLQNNSNKLQNNSNKLQNNLNTYKYSNYVRDNLKHETIHLKTNSVTKASKQHSKQLALTKRQLIKQKSQSSKNIQNTVSNNGLYKATFHGDDKILINTASLDNILALVLRNNLEIKSSKKAVLASLSKYDQVSFLDDMLNQYAAFTNTKKTVPFPFPGLLNLKSSIINQSIETDRLRLKQKVQDIITQTRLTYTKLQFTRAEIVLIKKNIHLLKSLKKELQNNYSSNTGKLNGVVQVEIDIAKNRNNLQTAKDKLKIQSVQLNTLLNRSPELILGKLDKRVNNKYLLVKNSTTYIKKAQKNRIEIVILQSQLLQMKKVIQLSKKRFYPNLDSGLSVLKNGKFSNKPKIKTNNTLAKDNAYLSETKARAKALTIKIMALKTTTANDIQEYVSKHHSAVNTQNLYQNKILPKSKVALEIANNTYETGKASYASVIDENIKIMKYHQMILTSQYNAIINTLKLERIISSK